MRSTNPENTEVHSGSFWRGLLAGFVAALVMSCVMLFEAWLFGVATPLTIFGDRLSAFIPADTFLALMGRVGGYNHMKQLGVVSVLGGQLVLGALGGAIFARMTGDRRARVRVWITFALFVFLPLAAVSALLWPVLGTHYFGLPIARATTVTLFGLFVAFVCFERTLVLGLRYLSSTATSPENPEFTPTVSRRAIVFGGAALLVAGGVAGLLRKLYGYATFSYDGTQYKGRSVQAITPNEQFYCVTKNVIDPDVNAALWRLEVSGRVDRRQTYRLDRLRGLPAITQETTLMCISNGLDAGLMSNAVWKGVSMATLLQAAGVQSGATKVRLHGVDNYTDTFPLEKALDPTTLIAYEMNGEPLPQRHGFPARAIVPGYFGEKHVKWITRIEVGDDSVLGFYEQQGWGPDFIVPTRSRIDEPADGTSFDVGAAARVVTVRGVAFGGDRGIQRVEVSFSDGGTWTDAHLDYPGTRLTWALWSFAWHPPEADDYMLVVRATDGEGEVQELEEDRPFKSGTTGFHKIMVHVTG
ncbi:MAG: molybdopterin-dependent oxidoreductase [Verrucomicrobiota bacterium]|nr:molybdopterin-dependent oxidoreductase [Verrucomicrobiota bacterium]